MSINKITLSPFLIKSLFENDLIETNAAVSTKKAKDTNNETESNSIKKEIIGNIKYLGKNEKSILILVHRETHAFLDDESLSFLMAILNACGLSMQDVALVNVHNNEEAVYQNLNEQFEPTIILFFDTTPDKLNFPVKIPMYKIQKYNNQQYLCAASLSSLNQDKDEKKKLWNCLKMLLGI